MLKMTVRPLAIKKSSIPYRTPFSVDMTISSSTTLHLREDEPTSLRRMPERRKFAR
jgi:hypothetical protein